MTKKSFLIWCAFFLLVVAFVVLVALTVKGQETFMSQTVSITDGEQVTLCKLGAKSWYERGSMCHLEPAQRFIYAMSWTGNAISQAQLGKESIVAGACDESLWAHVYNAQRLKINARCVTVVGAIMDASHGKNKDGCRHEADGDGHCWLKLDDDESATIKQSLTPMPIGKSMTLMTTYLPVPAGSQNKYLNEKNMQNQDGNLVFEPICRYRVTQADAVAACKNWKQQLKLAPVGSHVAVTGAWVLDAQHGHEEIHPVTSIMILRQK